MQGEGKRPPSQHPPLHEQLSPPAGIPPHHPLSTPPPPSSLTTPLPLKKKKLLKVILKSPPTPNPNRLSPSLSSSPSSPPSPSLSTPLLPHHHHHLQQHQLHHHQQLLLQQQHLHKQKLLQQQTQQLASELQLKLHQQHLLQQEHPKLLEQFKQQLQQEQICASTAELQAKSGPPQWQATSKEQRRNLKGQRLQQETCEFQERGRFLQEDRKDTVLCRRRGRSEEISCDVPPEERFAAHKSRFHSEGGAHVLQGDDTQECLTEYHPNEYEQSILQAGEHLQRDGEPSTKRLKSEQHYEGNHHVRSSLRGPNTLRSKLAPHATGKEDQITGFHGSCHILKSSAVSSNGLPPPSRLASASSSAATVDASRKLKHAVDAVTRNGLPSFTKPVSEGVGLKDGTATGPLSKTLGGSGNTSVPGRKVLRGILDKLQKKDSYGAFAEPVDVKEVPDYYDVIKEPMDFGTMRKRISSGFYISLELFEKDIFAICSNAMTFNATGTVYHRQARAIKTAAERILDALKTSGPAMADEASLKQKAGASQVKKSHKKKQPWKSWTSDYVSEPLRNMGGRGTGKASAAACLAESYYVDWQAGIGQTSNKIYADDKEDATGYLAKSLGLYDGRRLPFNEESRRGTYKPISDAGSSSLVTTVAGGPLQFVPAAFQLDFSYARSLARFAADLGPDVWKVAAKTITRALPMGVPFGPGWVGQREAAGRSFSLTTNKAAAHCSTDSTGKDENVSIEVRARVGSSVLDGPIDGKRVVTTADQNSVGSLAPHRDCAGTSIVNHRSTDEGRLSDMAHVSQIAPQVFLEGGKRDTELLVSCDGDRGHRQEELYYPPSQATCQGGTRETELLPDCESDPVLIPGRNLDERICIEYKHGQPAGLDMNPMSGLAPMSGAPMEVLQIRLNDHG